MPPFGSKAAEVGPQEFFGFLLPLLKPLLPVLVQGVTPARDQRAQECGAAKETRGPASASCQTQAPTAAEGVAASDP
jgi:hypothetical protein